MESRSGGPNSKLYRVSPLLFGDRKKRSVLWNTSLVHRLEQPAGLDSAFPWLYQCASPGHCRYSWMIQSRSYSYPSRFKVCRVCFKETLGSSKCQGTRRSCSGWAAPGRNPSWALDFHDDTDYWVGYTYNWYLDCTLVPFAVFCPTNSPCKEIF